jgi:hypothetical protein
MDAKNRIHLFLERHFSTNWNLLALNSFLIAKWGWDYEVSLPSRVE